MLISKTITGALRMLGVIAVGEVPTANELEDALEVLNTFIDRLNIDGAVITYSALAIYYPNKELDSLLHRKMTITNNPDYLPVTPFTEGFVQAEAPVELETLQLVDTNNNTYRLKRINKDIWAGQMNNLDTVARPTEFFVNFNGDLVEVYFNTQWDEQYTVAAFVKLPYLGTSGDYKATDDINWNYGVERMLRTNLAVMLAPEYGVQVPPTVYKESQDLLNDIRAKSFTPDLMTTNSSTEYVDTGTGQ